VTVAVVIPAKDEAARVAETVRAALALGDVVVVVDDGSADDTAAVAAAAGARVVRHPRNRGKAAAMTSGAAAVPDADLLLFLDADLRATAAEAATLVEAVAAGDADCAIALLPRAPGAGGHGLVVNLAREAIERATGWRPEQPLSGQRCLTRAAFAAVLPLAPGFGVETAMTIDLLRAGYRVVEVPTAMAHRVTGTGWRDQLHRARQYRDVRRALRRRR
jgi:glycosyltransferase involved in cell wall biosynthesis